MAICKCPAAAALPNIPNFKCAESFGQIQKVAFQRLYKSAGGKNSFTAEAGIGKLASWSPLLAAEDDTKIVISPYIQAPTAEAGAPRTFGGGNETLGGIEEVIGREPTPFTGVIRKMPQSLIKALKELQCESDSQNLGVYLFDENGSIGALQDPTTGLRNVRRQRLFRMESYAVLVVNRPTYRHSIPWFRYLLSYFSCI